MAVFEPLLSWVSFRSPTVLGTTRDHSPGSHCSGSPPIEGVQAHSCGPVVVLRAANNRPPNGTMPGIARWYGSSVPSALPSTTTDVFAAQSLEDGVVLAQSEQAPEHGPGLAVVERTRPPLLPR